MKTDPHEKQSNSTAPRARRSSRPAYTVEACTPAIGAEITGLDLAEAGRNPDLAAELRALWLERKVLFFRQQSISAPELQAFHPKAQLTFKEVTRFIIAHGG